MPAYGTQGPTALYPGDHKYLFGTSFTAAAGPTPGQIQAPNDANVLDEVLVAPAKSIPVQLVSVPGRNPGAMVQISANANPGAAIFVIQEAAEETDSAYLTPAPAAYTLNTWTAGADGEWYVWTQLQPDSAVFLRLTCTANPNAVGFSAKIVYV